MNNVLLFIFGLVAVTAAIGPLVLALYLDLKENKK